MSRPPIDNNTHVVAIHKLLDRIAPKQLFQEEIRDALLAQGFKILSSQVQTALKNLVRRQIVLSVRDFSHEKRRMRYSCLVPVEPEPVIPFTPLKPRKQTVFPVRENGRILPLIREDFHPLSVHSQEMRDDFNLR